MTSLVARAAVVAGGWGGLVAAWQLIGEDFAIDFLWWQATGDSLRGAVHVGDRSGRDRARTFFEAAGINFSAVQ